VENDYQESAVDRAFYLVWMVILSCDPQVKGTSSTIDGALLGAGTPLRSNLMRVATANNTAMGHGAKP